MNHRLRDLSFPLRLAVLMFVLSLAAAYGLAQGALWAEGPPGPQLILEKYRGRLDAARLETVLSAGQPRTGRWAMWPYLDPLGDEARIAARRGVVMDWIEAGAPEAGWDPVRRVLHEQGTCLQCHQAGRSMHRVPLTSYDAVRPLARRGERVPVSRLFVSAHMHLFGFALWAFLLSGLMALTRFGPGWKIGLPVLAFAGALLDIGGWFLTWAVGMPGPWVVMGGGALFGLGVGALTLAVVVDLLR